MLTDEECDEIIRAAAELGEFLSREAVRFVYDWKDTDMKLEASLAHLGYRNGQK